ncbi:MAG TPA: glycosyltransferase family 2 protein [Ktedonobacterales bacterium]|nr:glycosyltransferase family 2 protein [Ktedonobacterales bacterium]
MSEQPTTLLSAPVETPLPEAIDVAPTEHLPVAPARSMWDEAPTAVMYTTAPPNAPAAPPAPASDHRAIGRASEALAEMATLPLAAMAPVVAPEVAPAPPGEQPASRPKRPSRWRPDGDTGELRSMWEEIYTVSIPAGVRSYERSTPAQPPRRLFPRGIPSVVAVMSARQRYTYLVFLTLWLVALADFWWWWFQPSHVVGIGTFVVTTILIAYLLVPPGYMFFLLGRLHRPNEQIPMPKGLRVALATSFVPGSESNDVLMRTLRAMNNQQGVGENTVDVWVLDEGASAEARELVEHMGGFYFTRKGVAWYQQPKWPFKAKYKAGNYNAWLDLIGYEQYDILIQMDTDHAPTPTYLQEVLRPFANPDVAYVAAPSDVSGNINQSWLVKARVSLDSILHGPMQMGFNHRLCPIVIGSHWAVRIPALKAIGGFQQTRAEDHHNTLRLASQGYRGVFAPDAWAIGDGALTLGEALSQEYQWARSICNIFFQFFWRDSRELRFWQWFEFFFCETWYIAYAFTMALGFLIPILALLTNIPWARINYFAFVFHFELVDAALIVMMMWVRRQGWLRPSNSHVISWESALFTLARWPTILLAVADSLLDSTLGHLLKRDLQFGVTKKGSGPVRPLAWSTLLVFFLMICGTFGVAIWYLLTHADADSNQSAMGYTFLAILNGVFYTIMLLSVIILHARDARRAKARPALRGITSKFLASLLMVALCFASVALLVNQFAPTLVAPVASQANATSTPISTPLVMLPVSAPAAPFLGAYDPYSRLTNQAGIQTQEFFVDWSLPALRQTLIDDVRQAQSLGRFPVITLEPWVDGVHPATAAERAQLLPDIAAGIYDDREATVVAALKAVAPQVVIIRFGHEMNLFHGVYPWATPDAASYIAAFRQFVFTLRAAHVQTARFMWSPASLNAQTLPYYPGDDVVDYVGDTLLDLTSWPKPFTGDPQPFDAIVASALTIAGQIKKPMIVAEFGEWISSLATAERWVASILQTLHEQPQWLAGIIYYDARTATVWGPKDAVDWELPPSAEQLLFARRPCQTQTRFQPLFGC